MDDIDEHLRGYVADDPDALVFTGRTGAPLRRGNYDKLAKWREAVARIGASGLHFHDLRHTGNTLAAVTTRKRGRRERSFQRANCMVAV